MSRLALVLIIAASGCDKWDSVRSSYCSHHAGVGDCAAGGQGGGNNGGGGNNVGGNNGGGNNGGGASTGGGSASIGGGAASTGGGSASSTDDGGPPVDWVRVLGGVHDDDALSLALDPLEAHVAVGGHFVGAIDLGGTSFIGLGGNSLQAMFVAELDANDGGITDGVAVSCSSAPEAVYSMPLIFTDAGLVLASTCYSPPGTIISRDGATLALDGGLVSNQGSDPFLLQLGAPPVLEFLNTPPVYEPDKRVIATAAQGLPYFLLAVDTVGGALLFGDAGLTDGGSSPMLARIGAFDLQAQGVDTVDCPGTQTVEWENVAADPSGQHVFGIVHSSTNPMSLYCSANAPEFAYSSGAGNTNPGLHRLVYVFGNAGDSFQNLFSFGDTLPDAGPLLLASDQPRSVYFAGYVAGSPQNLQLDAGTLLVGNLDPTAVTISAASAFVPTAGSSASFAGLAVVPGVSPDIWVLGTVTGTLADGTGAKVVSSLDAHSDAFLMKLNPTTLLPVQAYVLGRTNVDETAAGLAVQGHHVYVALTVAPQAGVDAASFMFGGVPAPLLGGRDVLVFRLTVP